MPTCIICKTLEGDVKDGLKELNRSSKEMIKSLKESETVPIMQVGMRKYANLKKAEKDDIIKEIEKKHVTHILNLSRLSIHKKNCSHAGKNTIPAYIVNDCVTGLHRCKYCMS